MNFDKLQEMIKDIILRELQTEYGYDFKYMSNKEDKKYKEAIERGGELFDIINSKLDEEGKRALNQLVELKDIIATQESDYYFERGVRIGLTDLSYLKKYCNWF